MAALYHSLLASPPFKFLVGLERKPFILHSALLAHHSEPLGNLVNGGMSEAAEGCALLEEVDEDTFVQFSQFAYTGDYDIGANPKTPTTAPIVQASDVAPQAAEPASEEPDNVGFGDGWDDPIYSTTKKSKKKAMGFGRIEPVKSMKAQLWDDFQVIKYSSTGIAGELCEIPDNYTETLLSHAKLYVFADYYRINSLRELSLRKLHQTLALSHLAEERVLNFVKVQQWVYSRTCDGGPGKRMDDLRLLLAHYAVCEIETLTLSEEFESLEENGALG